MPELIEIEIPDNVAEYLEPVPGGSAAGIDAVNDPEYFKLSMEIPKAVPDYKKWIELCSLILKEKSKDLKVVTWLSFALYRTDGIKGFNLGLNILLHLLKRFGNTSYPANPAHKIKALQFLSNSRVIKFIEKEQIDNGSIVSITETKKIVEEIINECRIVLPDSDAAFKPLDDVLSMLIKSAQQIIKPVEKEVKKETPSQIPKEPVVQSVRSDVDKRPPVPMQQTAFVSENDLTVELRKTIAAYFEYEEDGTKKQRIPELYQIFALSRILQWGSLSRPVDNNGVTAVEAPNKVIQGLIKEWFTMNDTDVLISRIESEFIKENSAFRYWLDAQRYLVLALESKGGNYKTAAEDVKTHLSLLLNRIKDLPQLKFKDKQTLFADTETISWLNEEIINRSIGNSKSTESNSAIIFDDAFNDIIEEYKKISVDPPESFEKNLMKMQSDMNNDDRQKGKFLRRMNIADYCYKHKEFNLARVISLELKELIRELNLSRWEPALCASLWQLHYHINKEIMFHNKDETLNKKLLAEQEELFYDIAKYNGILALNLSKQKR